jgi:putative CocE/NonD family hydrolase
LRPDLSESKDLLPMQVTANLAHELIHAAVGVAASHQAFRRVASGIGLVGQMAATTAGLELAELMNPGEIHQFTIQLYSTSNLFKAAHRIRLDISSSNFPRFDPNPNTGEPLNDHTHTLVARNTIHHDAAHPSHAILPIIPLR